ncbi:MAG: hypothetical protein ACRDQ0_20245 [Pseudonocardia sp.]
MMNAYAVTLDVELRRHGDAVCTANGFDTNQIPSLARRGRHLIEVARAYQRRHDAALTYAMLGTAPETSRFNGYARDMSLSLAAALPLGYETRCPRCADGQMSSCSTPGYGRYPGR